MTSAPFRHSHLDDAPPVSAEFRTTLTFPWGEQSRVNWRFWRNRDRIERENLTAHSGEVWVQDGKTLFHTRLYHVDKRGIEYRNEDLQMLNVDRAWITPRNTPGSARDQGVTRRR